MLGDVVDEDELAYGTRREGIYAGFFTFLRKLSGALGVALAFMALDWVGFRGAAEGGGGPQSPQVLLAIRSLAAGVPMLFVVLACAVAWGYPLSRARHAAILRELRERRPEH